MEFEIKQQFERDGQPFKILSGAIHYFRIDPSQWYDTLYNLRALGFNTVETYIPWNLHEPQRGHFDFSGRADLEKFIAVAADLGLYVILRPTPFICAEWELGGLPAWLLEEPHLHLRSSDPAFLAAVQDYYRVLLPRLVPLQVTHGGPVLMMQVENEYGSFGDDQDYLAALVEQMRAGGVDVPLFTADGTWIEALTAGNLAAKNILTAGNFGSQATANFDALSAFFQQQGKHWPLLCMEYWDGWFNRWGEAVIKRDPAEMVADLRTLLQRGSVNLYMFRGGTNFGFMNGCSARGQRDLPQVTSYDYDAILDEAGVPTAKYRLLQKMIHELFPTLPQATPRQPALTDYGQFAADGTCGLLDHADLLTKVTSRYPQSFEQLKNYYGYVLYRTTTPNFNQPEALKVIDAGDRVQLFVNQQWLATQTQAEIGTEVTYEVATECAQIDVLVENQGRVNYGPKLNAPTQRKGIKGGVMVDHQFQVDWTQYLLPFDAAMMAKLSFTSVASGTIDKPTQPTFTHFTVKLAQTPTASTYLDCSAFGKGCITINGFNLGRYWSRGPIHSLYVPAGVMQEVNEIVVFETENVAVTTLTFSATPVIDAAK